MTRHRWRGRLLAALLTTALALIGLPALTTTATAAGGPNLAAGKTATASSSNSGYTPANITDGNAVTYWESSGSNFPSGRRRTSAPRPASTRWY